MSKKHITWTRQTIIIVGLVFLWLLLITSGVFKTLSEQRAHEAHEAEIKRAVDSLRVRTARVEALMDSLWKRTDFDDE